MTSSFMKTSGGNFSPRIGLDYFWYIPIKSLIYIWLQTSDCQCLAALWVGRTFEPQRATRVEDRSRQI
jgi:hypothetical protein